MATLEQDVDIIEHTLCECAKRYATSDNIRTLMAFDPINGQFLLLDEGWEASRRIHQVWIHEDGTEVGVANLLAEAGVPHNRIILAFNAPALRPTTDFVVG